MRFQILLICVFISVAQLSFSQIQETSNVQFFELMKARNASNPTEINGSEFLYTEWLPMKIIMEDGKTFDVNEARINIMGGSVDVMYKGREMELLTNFVQSVEVNNNGIAKKMTPIFRIKAKDLPEKGFVEVYGEGDDKVLVRHHKYLVKGDPNAKILGIDPRPKIMNIEDMYIIHQKTAYQYKSKKDLKKIYGNKYKKIETLIKNNKIDEKDPVQIGNLLDQISQEKMEEKQ